MSHLWHLYLNTSCFSGFCGGGIAGLLALFFTGLAFVGVAHPILLLAFEVIAGVGFIVVLTAGGVVLPLKGDNELVGSGSLGS